MARKIMEGRSAAQERAFCRAYLKTLDPERAAEACGAADGYRMLRRNTTKQTLERMRAVASGALCGEDVTRRLAHLAFGQANDAVRLALDREGAKAQELDLSAVAEIKVTDKGVEVKLIDRIRALETLWRLLQEGRSDNAAALYSALAGMEESDDENDGE
ncbi:MAG: terminase small subunit [Oscillibacter sp.]|nr:terminase small subunit [Oscillibacter sp.]